MDSTFCKHCGASLPDDEIKESREKLEELVQTGFDLLKDGRADEAMIIAENAVTSNPSSAAALSLKGMCHEGRGEAAEALECYEKVVELKPDSALDKIKVNQLRNLMVAKVTTPPPTPDRKGAFLVAAAVTILVVVGGAIVVRTLNRPTQVASNGTQLPLSNTVTQSFDTPMNTPAPQTTPQATATPAPDPTPYGGPNGTGLPRFSNSQDGRLPGAGDDVGDDPNHSPVVVEGPNPTPPAPTPTAKTDEVVIPPNGPTPTPQPTRDPGQIIVKVHGQGSSPAHGSGNPSGDSGPAGNGLQAVLAAARNNFQLGHYSDAAQNYERAISMGGGRASSFQRLGDCYRNLGQSSRAVDAYNNAADRFEASGDKTGADACRQAIKGLKGN